MHNRVLWVAIAIPVLAVFSLLLPVIHDMVAHNYRLYSLERFIDSLDYEDYGELVASDSDLGLLVGNGNHTDYWVMRLVRCKDDPSMAIEKIKGFYKSGDFLPDVVLLKEFRSKGMEMDDLILSKYSDFVEKDNIVLISLFLSLDPAGYDPRSH